MKDFSLIDEETNVNAYTVTFFASATVRFFFSDSLVGRCHDGLKLFELEFDSSGCLG